MRRWQLVTLWLVAVVAATAGTWQIVSFADDGLGPSDTTALDVPGLPTGDGGSSTTSSSTSSSASPSSTASRPSSTTTSPAADLMTVPTQGGNVTVKVTPGAITLVSVDPAPGFSAEIDKAGPPEVRVELIGADVEVEVRVEWEDGRVQVDIDVDD